MLTKEDLIKIMKLLKMNGNKREKIYFICGVIIGARIGQEEVEEICKKIIK